MGFLDDILGKVTGGTDAQGPAGGNPLEAILGNLGGGGGKNAAILMAAMALLQKSGGLSGLLQKFQKSGLGEEASSWIGTGANKAITGDSLSKVFGASAMSSFASDAGVEPSEASSTLAKVLPDLVNQFTPNGAVEPESEDMCSKGMDLLKGMMG